MSYLDDIAGEIERRVDPRLLPSDGSRELFRLYAVLALAKGPAVRVDDIHDAWVAWELGRDACHRSIKPFDELDAETQAADEPFARAVPGTGLFGPLGFSFRCLKTSLVVVYLLIRDFSKSVSFA